MIKIFTVTGKDRSLFSDFIPENILAETGEDGSFTLGAFDDAMNMRPAGFLQFVARLKDDKNHAPILDISWIYVREEYRYERCGTMLVDCLLEIASKSGATGTMITLPEDVPDEIPERDNDSADRAPLPDLQELKRCLVAQGFSFDGRVGTCK